ncbi:hypothetical protein EJ08DRAFT_666489 [Tothia fuscella]|uniref:Uncharacterized protein n=1 Tax=Tothia fuscella TaxID=1048955 RepID=A0A9P4TSU1_9PEZI|nr:hypothetical protein EJ08DRAFT_666489 [Tothia fuscella]
MADIDDLEYVSPNEEYNLDLVFLFGEPAGWPDTLRNMIRKSLALLALTSEDAEAALRGREYGSILEPKHRSVLVNLLFENRALVGGIMVFLTFLYSKFDAFTKIPMKEYSFEVQTFNTVRRACGLIEFRALCHAAKACTSADLNIIRTIVAKEESPGRTLFPRLEANSRFHNLPRTLTALPERGSSITHATTPISAVKRGKQPQLSTSTFPYFDLPVISESIRRHSTSPPKTPSLRRESRRIGDMMEKPNISPETQEHLQQRILFNLQNNGFLNSEATAAKELRDHGPRMRRGVPIERLPTVRRPTYEGMSRLFSSPNKGKEGEAEDAKSI